MAVRSSKINDIRTNILEGHLSAALCDMGNISYLLFKNPQMSKSGKLYKATKIHLNLSSVSKAIFPPMLLASIKHRPFLVPG